MWLLCSLSSSLNDLVWWISLAALLHHRHLKLKRLYRFFKHLSILASDEYEGRETGKKGAWMAAEYIAKQFKSYGLVGPVKGNSDPFLQPVGISSKVVSTATLKVGTQNKENLKDFYVLPQSLNKGEFEGKEKYF